MPLFAIYISIHIVHLFKNSDLFLSWLVDVHVAVYLGQSENESSSTTVSSALILLVIRNLCC